MYVVTLWLQTMTNDLDDAQVVELLNQYGPIVKRIAKSACYSSATIDLQDLYQVGEIAVLHAVKSYDPSCGTTIKSFVSRVVRNRIFREAARFLGVFTVDHRVTSLAAKVNKLYAKGHSDEEISDILSGIGDRNFDSDHVRDLRIAYSRRQHIVIEDDDTADGYITKESTIQDLLLEVVQNDIEKTILDRRILGDASIKEVSAALGVTQKQLYDFENTFKERIRKAIEGITE